MASMIRFATTIKVGNPRLTRRCVRSSVEFYTSGAHDATRPDHRDPHVYPQSANLNRVALVGDVVFAVATLIVMSLPK
jgi:hypothetical protein